MNNNQNKLISIGLPVYNGEKYISQTLDSLLAQDYQNFELIISDNASTDGTGEICREYQAKDKRIQYSRNERNLGSHRNFNRVFKLSSGEYFMWASASDLWDKTYISRCKEVLDNDPSVVLCYSQTILIDFQGNKLGILPDRFDTHSLTNPALRFSQTLWKIGWGNILYGLIRSEALRQTRLLIPVISASDHLLLAELSIRGSFVQIPLPLFYRRQSSLTERSAVKQLIAATSNKKITLPHCRTMFHALMAVKNAPFSFKDKLKLMVDVSHCVIKRFGVLEEILKALYLLGLCRFIRKLGKLPLFKKISS